MTDLKVLNQFTKNEACFKIICSWFWKNIFLFLQVSPDSSGESCIFFVWPLEIVHVIDKDSPLYDMAAADITKEKFEIIVIMEGTIETSSMTFQARYMFIQLCKF